MVFHNSNRVDKNAPRLANPLVPACDLAGKEVSLPGSNFPDLRGVLPLSRQGPDKRSNSFIPIRLKLRKGFFMTDQQATPVVANQLQQYAAALAQEATKIAEKIVHGVPHPIWVWAWLWAIVILSAFALRQVVRTFLGGGGRFFGRLVAALLLVAAFLGALALTLINAPEGVSDLQIAVALMLGPILGLFMGVHDARIRRHVRKSKPATLQPAPVAPIATRARLAAR